MTTRASFSWKALFGCSRGYGREPCDMDERTLAVPNVGMGSWRLGLSLYQAIGAVSLRMDPSERVKVISFNDQEVVLVLPHGVLLSFDRESQLLERITTQHPWPPNGLSIDVPSGSSTQVRTSPMRICENGQHLSLQDIKSFPLRTWGQTSAESSQELCYEGIRFTRSSTDRDLCEGVSVVADTVPLTPLCPPNGLVARQVSCVSEPGSTLFTGLKFDLEIGVSRDSVDWSYDGENGQGNVSGKESESSSPEYSHTDSRYVSFGDSEQEVKLAIGEPQGTFTKHIRVEGNTDRKYRAPEFFYNYNVLGVDIMFNGVTRRVMKFILHTNAVQSVHFGQYARCPFVLQVRCCCNLSLQEKHRPHGTGQHSKKEIRPSSHWSDIQEHVLCGCASEECLLKYDNLRQPPGENNATQLKTLCCVYDQFAFEVLNNDCFAMVTVLQHCAHRLCRSQGKNPHRSAAENFDCLKRSSQGSSLQNGPGRTAGHRRTERKLGMVASLISGEEPSRRSSAIKSESTERRVIRQKENMASKPAVDQSSSAFQESRKESVAGRHKEPQQERPSVLETKEKCEKTDAPERTLSGEKVADGEDEFRRELEHCMNNKETTVISENSEGTRKRMSKQKPLEVRQTTASLARRARSLSAKGKGGLEGKQNKGIKRTPSERERTLSEGKQSKEKRESARTNRLSNLMKNRSEIRPNVHSGSEAAHKDNMPDRSPNSSLSWYPLNEVHKDDVPGRSPNSSLSWYPLDEVDDSHHPGGVSFQDYRQAFAPRRALARSPPASPPAARKLSSDTQYPPVFSSTPENDVHQCEDNSRPYINDSESRKTTSKFDENVTVDGTPAKGNGHLITTSHQHGDVITTSSHQHGDVITTSSHQQPAHFHDVGDGGITSDMGCPSPPLPATPVNCRPGDEIAASSPNFSRKTWGPPRADLLDEASQSLHEDDTLIEVLEHGHHDVVQVLSAQTKLLVELKHQWLDGNISSALLTICRRSHDDENNLATLVNILSIICDERLVRLYPTACLQVIPLLKMLVGPMKPENYVVAGSQFVVVLMDCLQSSSGKQSREVVLDREMDEIRKELLRFRAWLNGFLEHEDRRPELNQLFDLRQRLSLL